ncbi:hypothetical protein [Rhizobium sp. L1K21]|uniref:hypothetical protein n=1 Tax=Rhizobium sp. L1K21 TaxID=2954933 RepID=UPI0020932998|nr:hypothetical protein [Rhizobium sp. L1K21]MCO6187790.1 hypothetical protein [Rhizobium sp. L1K21]
MTNIGDFILSELRGLPDWIVTLILFVGALLVSLGLFKLLYRFLEKMTSSRQTVAARIVRRGRRPLRLAVIAISLTLASAIAPLTNAQAAIVRHILIIVTIAIIGWICHIALELWMYVYLRNYKLDAEDNLYARKHVTQTRILQRVANFLIIMISIAWALMTFEPVR